MANLVELHTLSRVHLVLLCLSRHEIMLQADDLVDSVAEAGHFLAALVQTVLREAVLHD